MRVPLLLTLALCGSAAAQAPLPSEGLLKKHGLERLDPVWTHRWQGKAKAGPQNAWDVHVYKGRVYAVGVKCDKRLFGARAPLVFKCFRFDGSLVWERTWKGYSGKHGTGAGGTVILGHGDALYVGGAVPKDAMNAALLQKWDLKGNLIWTEHWGNKVDGGHHEVNGLAIVGDALYVSHYSAAARLVTIDAHIKQYSLAKLNARRPRLEAMNWARYYGKADSHNTTDGHIYADATGVYVCGQYGGLKGSNVYNEGDSYLVKYSPRGKQLWMKLYTGNGTGTDNAFSLTSDGKHVYVTGPTMTQMKRKLGSIPLGLEIQVFVQKYTMAGKLVWTRLYGGPKIEYSRGIAVDGKHVFVSASTKSYVEGKDNTILWKLDKRSGKVVSRRLWGGEGDDGVATSIALGEPGFIYMSGKASSAADGSDTGAFSAVVMKVRK